MLVYNIDLIVLFDLYFYALQWVAGCEDGAKGCHTARGVGAAGDARQAGPGAGGGGRRRPRGRIKLRLPVLTRSFFTLAVLVRRSVL